MRFVFTAPRYHTNQHFAMKALLDAGHEVSFLALKKRRSEVYDALAPTILEQSSITHVFRRERMSLPPVLRFVREMWDLKPDVVVVRNPLSAYGMLSIMTARLMRSTVVFYSQTPVFRTFGWWQRFIRSSPAWAANAKWITPVLGDPDEHPKAFDALRYLPFVMEPQTAPDQRRWFRNNTINVLCVAKFMERKNHRLFLQAISRLSTRHKVRATIIGECSGEPARARLTEIKHFLRCLGLEEEVHLKTNLSYWDVQREYTEHDLFVLPSSDEPAAVSPLEAMSHSLPVICSDSNGTQCYIRPGENGYVFRTDDLADLQQCMERIVTDRGTLMEMGARSYDLVVSGHSPERYVESLVSIAEENG